VRYALLFAGALLVCGVADGGAFPGSNGPIVFSRTADPDAVLVAVDPSTGAQRVLGPGAEPAWSSDGSKLAFVRSGTVYIANADGAAAAAVGSGEYPAWSPDGSHLVVSRHDATPAMQLVVLDLGGGPATPLTDGTVDATLPAWSPDGTTIAYASAGSLATVPATGGTPQALQIPAGTVNGGPSWSPDGSMLAFIDAGGQVRTIRADGSDMRQITYTLVGPNGPATRPAWSPDGGSIAWTSNADLCVTDLAGQVTRVTRSQKTTPNVVASLPDWQLSSSGGGSVVAAPPGANDSVGCDWNPGGRVEMLEGNVSPSILTLAAPAQIVFVNHLTRPLTVTTTMPGAHATIDAGRFAAFVTLPGTFDFTVSGYPDGAVRRGTFIVAAGGSVTIEQHAAIRYGTRTVITGVASGRTAGSVTVKAQPFGSSIATQVATLTPKDGRWQLSVAPAITTRYLVSYLGATAGRLLRVKPDLRVSRSRNALRISLRPAGRLAHKTVYVFRLGPDDWAQYRSARTGGDGVAVVRNLPKGRYYVGFEGGADFWGTASEPFTVRR
jgi:WD40 repeat protein